MSARTLFTRPVEFRRLLALGHCCGILVSDPASGECAFRFRRDWDAVASAEPDNGTPADADILQAIAEDLPARRAELGTEAFLHWLDNDLSNAFRAEPPQPTLAYDLQRTAQALFRHHVATPVRRFQTHLPLIPIDLAAGGLGEDRATGAEEWVDVDLPQRRSLDGLFLVRIHGHSMEPDIPDGSLCLFRPYQGGSRQHGIYIVQRRGSLDEGGEFTIKRYESTKVAEAGSWRHAAIGMNPDNPDYAPWALSEEEDRWATVAQFLAVVEDPLL